MQDQTALYVREKLLLFPELLQRIQMISFGQLQDWERLQASIP